MNVNSGGGPIISYSQIDVWLLARMTEKYPTKPAIRNSDETDPQT